ncbi:DUF4215 domain-containing protein [Nannocystis sp. SCPEA4]|uniref:DUF4215 domain-containing protein n=1 Tax=Nannocystis sp. SCPEA4 TaxID=2996787 RepID=UPI00226EE5BA|nr:DUF4215 domain-containing protein [Nannocystis sp. SCPEA4]MCY1056428.1 DUF4215 domain-containing protein [Nannocystis sp. SCPEA4]
MPSRSRRAPPRRLAALTVACTACFSDLGPSDTGTGSLTGVPEPTTTTGDVTGLTTEVGPVCGDGEVQPGEQCDAGPLNGDWAACKTDCTLASCGDGLRGPTEECDGGDDCLADCTVARCGDGLVNRDDELCDDGNLDDTDGCAHTCRPSGCGDGVVQDGEACDHGPLNADTAACTLACAAAVCGDGLVGPGEACEPSIAEPPCADDCSLLSCPANTEPDPGEECQVADAGCTDLCILDECGDGYPADGEACDDGNLVGGDGCAWNCQPEMCGDGLLVPGEACDDGNDVAGDGCSPTCERDAYFVFVTAETTSGALGTLAAADKFCQDSALAAELPGIYRAWLSFPGDPPAARLTKASVPYVLPGSLDLVAADWLALVSGSLAHAIDRTAAGAKLMPGFVCSDPANLAWTHTRATGSPFAGDPCSGWLLGSGTAVAGLVHATNLGWTEGCADVDCAQKLRLYCIEQ